MKKLLVSDYDGTFYLNDTDIKNNIELINKFRNNGNIFTIATGNNYKNFQKVITKYDIKYDYLILDQGSVLIDNSDKILNICYIEHDTVVDILNDIQSQFKLSIPDQSKRLTICNSWSEDGSLGENITKIAIRFDNLNIAKEFTTYIKDKHTNQVNAYTMIFPGVFIVEIISSQTSKNEAIKVLLNYEEINDNDVYTIGDGYNDMQMVKSFNGYCMKNSVEELLDVCNNQVASVSELIKKLL